MASIQTCAPEVLAIVNDYIDYHTIWAKIVMATVKIQTWWRKILKKRSDNSWDNSLDPPNWGLETAHPYIFGNKL